MDEAVSTQPLLETKISISVSRVMVGKSDIRRANFRSVDSSSVVVGGGGLRGLFRETKRSMERISRSSWKP